MTNLTATWEKSAIGTQLIADAIRDKAQGKPIRHTLSEAKEAFAKVNLELAQLLADRDLR